MVALCDYHEKLIACEFFKLLTFYLSQKVGYIFKYIKNKQKRSNRNHSTPYRNSVWFTSVIRLPPHIQESS